MVVIVVTFVVVILRLPVVLSLLFDFDVFLVVAQGVFQTIVAVFLKHCLCPLFLGPTQRNRFNFFIFRALLTVIHFHVVFSIVNLVLRDHLGFRLEV